MRYAKIKLSELPDTGVTRRRLVCDGYVMLNEKDVSSLGTETFDEIVARLGGVVLSTYEAKVELSKNKYTWLNK